jgi:electron transport complex protein RnfB
VTALIATLMLTVLVPLAAGILLVFSPPRGDASRRNETLADRVYRCLPQTQCGACGYPDCRSYAEAIVTGRTDIERCPPGGDYTISLLAVLLSGTPQPPRRRAIPEEPPRVAIIDERLCIGCVKCIHACPVDAILGAAKHMHTVMPKVCTGCGLCVAPCPVDCITLVPAGTNIKRFVWTKPQPITIESSA